jgi:hypothetical protein
MATIYKVEVVSYWIDYPKEELERMIQEALKHIAEETGNEIKVTVEL